MPFTDEELLAYALAHAPSAADPMPEFAPEFGGLVWALEDFGRGRLFLTVRTPAGALASVQLQHGQIWSMAQLMTVHEGSPESISELAHVAYALMSGWTWDALIGVLGDWVQPYRPYLDWVGESDTQSDEIPRHGESGG